MEKIDARTLSPQTQYEFRKQVILCRKRGMTNKSTAETVGISEQQASTIWQTFLRDGILKLSSPNHEAVGMERNGNSRLNRRQPFKSFW